MSRSVPPPSAVMNATDMQPKASMSFRFATMTPETVNAASPAIVMMLTTLSSAFGCMVRPRRSTMKVDRSIPLSVSLRGVVGEARDERIDRHGGLIARARTHVDLVSSRFVLADDEHVRHFAALLHRDLLLKTFVRVVDVDAVARVAQALCDRRGILELTVGDRQNHRLNRSEPHRESAAVMLDEHAEEPFERSEERTVDHDRAMLGAVLTDVRQLEALRQVEVDLHGRQLPVAADRIAHLDVELRAVERAAAFVHLIRKAGVLARLLDRVRGTLPRCFVTERFLRPRRDEELIVGESERAKDCERGVGSALEFAEQLIGRAEKMCVVLREAADPHEPVH